MNVHVHICATASVRGSEDSVQELIFSFHLVGSGDRTEVRLGGKC